MKIYKLQTPFGIFFMDEAQYFNSGYETILEIIEE